jgi:SAM-dependent methyltransferase
VFVASYTARTKPEGEIVRLARDFADRAPGRRLIDISCGPGHHAHLFTEWGFDVVGIDASPAMIERARADARSERAPDFRVADMRRVGVLFAENAFDGAWISASLLHIPETETPSVLAAVHRIVVDRGMVLITLKEGPQGSRIVRDEKDGQAVEREFTFWEEPRFRDLVERAGYAVVEVRHDTRGTTGGEPTHWLACSLRVVKT